VQQGGAVPVEEALQHRALGTGQRSVGTADLWCGPCHRTIMHARRVQSRTLGHCPAEGFKV
jgi:hypothetical protein